MTTDQQAPPSQPVKLEAEVVIAAYLQDARR